MVFMIRGLSSNWKQPFAYILIKHSLVPDLLWEMIKKGIVAVENAGYFVVNIVCDQECNQQKLFGQLKITPDAPYVAHPKDKTRKLYFLFDVPHLLKNIRNNLMNYNIVSFRMCEME